jgi:hypothetical protein
MSRAQLTSTVEQSSGGAVSPFLAGKNKVINGDFRIWQRGTSFTNPGTYTADRFIGQSDTTGYSVSQQAFTAGAAPVAGYEASYFWRYNRTSGSSAYNQLVYQMEDVRTFANQTVTLSFWAKADSARTLSIDGYQIFGTGGSPSSPSQWGVSGSASVTTAWQRFTFTGTVTSISGKTIGTNGSDNLLKFILNFGTATSFTFDIWGVQLEAGSVATPFTTASNTLQGELALAQRYYFRTYDVTQPYMHCFCYNGTSIQFNYRLPVTMRTTPSSMDYSNITIQDISSGTVYSASGAPSLNSANPDNAFIIWTSFSGLTTYRPYNIIGNGTLGYLGFSAEL